MRNPYTFSPFQRDTGGAMIKQVFQKLQRLARCAVFCLPVVALASGAPPNGFNVGLDFNWAHTGPAGANAAFISSPATSLATCVQPFNNTTSSCNFVFSVTIGANPPISSSTGGVYDTWPTAPTGDGSGGYCGTFSNPQSSPLTFYNCQNTNSFGQIFYANASGALSNVTMAMTCLNKNVMTSPPPPTGLYVVLYQLTAEGGSPTIASTPLTQTIPVDLSSCPTLSSWDGHHFSAGDFAQIPLDLSGVNVQSGNFYGIFFGGIVPGAALPGVTNVTAVNPATGPIAGGNTVTITGSNLTSASAVTFGGVAAVSFTVVNDTTITAVVPSGVAIGAVSVLVTAPNGTNAANTLYSYITVAPTVTSVSPASGSTNGGSTITITGGSFTGASAVSVGGTACTSFVVNSDVSISCTVPPHVAGVASVLVTNATGTNAANALYSYVVPDPIPPLGTLPPILGIGLQPVVLDLNGGSGPAMTDCLLAMVRAQFGADAQFVGQSGNGVAKFSLSGGRVISFYPLQAGTFAGMGVGLFLTGSNVLSVGISCGNFSIAPAFYNLAEFGALLNSSVLTANINVQGVVSLTAGGLVFVGRPDYVSSGGAAHVRSLVQGADGLYRMTDSTGFVQVIHPAFVDTDGLPTQVQLALATAGVTLIQTDGTALFVGLNGKQYVLTPDLVLTAAPAANAGQLWWQDGANHYQFRSNFLEMPQGFSVQLR